MFNHRCLSVTEDVATIQWISADCFVGLQVLAEARLVVKHTHSEQPKCLGEFPFLGQETQQRNAVPFGDPNIILSLHRTQRFFKERRADISCSYLQPEQNETSASTVP
mmetsp:Transcript_18799/g.51490  ORF Transcript_18799/g.51490 Transcript_18799/m.51490 type:complete len:108 (+) Transcript_18799:1335-1658(+)